MGILKDALVHRIETVVRVAGDLILSGLSTDRPGGGIAVKPGDSNFVTSLDLLVQEQIASRLTSLLPGAALIMEESVENPPASAPGWCFILDPVDGTTNLIHDARCSAVSLALLKDGSACLGIVYNPYLDEMFIGQAGCGSSLNGRRIHVSERPMKDALIGFGTTPYQKEMAGDTFRILSSLYLQCRDIRRSGTAAVDFAYLACGRLDGFIECKLQPWDYAAGKILIEEAGGHLTDFNGYDPQWTASSIAAGNAVLWEDLMANINAR